MRKFRTDLAADAVFSFKGSTYRTANHTIETADKELAEFLAANGNFAEVKSDKPEPKKADKPE